MDQYEDPYPYKTGEGWRMTAGLARWFAVNTDRTDIVFDPRESAA